MNPTTEITRLRLKVFVEHTQESSGSWEIAELSKNTLVLKDVASVHRIPQITLWMRALGKDTWKAFPLIDLNPAQGGISSTQRFTFRVEDQVEFSRCFDFSRLPR